MNLLRRVDRWWFGEDSPVALGVFRILMGALAFVNLAMISIDFDAWFTERGFVPIRVVPIYIGTDPRLNVLSGVADARVTLAVYLAIMLAALLTTFGLWTRISSIALAVGYVSLHHRNPLILHGGDLVLRISLMYLALAPCGKACSVDRLIGLWRGKVTGSPPDVSLWVQRLLQFQIALLYFTNVWHKMRGHYWREGIATWYPLHLNEFDRFWFPEALAENRLFLAMTTYGTLVVWFAMGTLVFYKPFRKWILLGAVGVHAFIDYAMNIPLFGFLMIATFVNFYDGEEVSGWARRVGERLSRLRLKVRLPAGAELSPRGANLLRALDPFGLVEYVPGDSPEWRAETSGGKPTNPFVGSYLRCLGAWWFGWIPGLWPALLRRACEKASDQVSEVPPDVAVEAAGGGER